MSTHTRFAHYRTNKGAAASRMTRSGYETINTIAQENAQIMDQTQRSSSRMTHTEKSNNKHNNTRKHTNYGKCTLPKTAEYTHKEHRFCVQSTQTQKQAPNKMLKEHTQKNQTQKLWTKGTHPSPDKSKTERNNTRGHANYGQKRTSFITPNNNKTRMHRMNTHTQHLHITEQRKTGYRAHEVTHSEKVNSKANHARKHTNYDPDSKTTQAR